MSSFIIMIHNSFLMYITYIRLLLDFYSSVFLHVSKKPKHVQYFLHNDNLAILDVYVMLGAHAGTKNDAVGQ